LSEKSVTFVVTKILAKARQLDSHSGSLQAAVTTLLLT
jgi:hypothetical protein